VPRRAAPEHTPLRAQLRVLARPALAGSFAVTILGYAGVFTAFTYLAPLVEIEAGAGPRTVTAVVTAFGVGGVIGNAVAARSSDTRMRATLLGALALLAVTLLVLPLTLGSVPLLVATVGLFGAAAFATVPGLQARVIGLAAGAPTLAAATNVAAFNLANTVGAALGGVVAAGAGLRWTAPAGGAVTLGGLLLAAAVLRRASPTTRANSSNGSFTGREA
jgi:DHA1 family inner membrane transport protein